MSAPVPNDTASDVAACVMCHDLPREFTQNCCPVCGRQRVDPFKLSPEQYGERLATAWADAMREVIRKAMEE